MSFLRVYTSASAPSDGKFWEDHLRLYVAPPRQDPHTLTHVVGSMQGLIHLLWASTSRQDVWPTFMTRVFDGNTPKFRPSRPLDVGTSGSVDDVEKCVKPPKGRASPICARGQPVPFLWLAGALEMSWGPVHRVDCIACFSMRFVFVGGLFAVLCLRCWVWG